MMQAYSGQNPGPVKAGVPRICSKRSIHFKVLPTLRDTQPKHDSPSHSLAI